MCFVEFFADKIPGVDSLWDVVHTFDPHSRRRGARGERVRRFVVGDDARRGDPRRHARGRQPLRQGRQPRGDQHVARAVLELGGVVRRGARRRRRCCGSRSPIRWSRSRSSLVLIVLDDLADPEAVARVPADRSSVLSGIGSARASDATASDVDARPTRSCCRCSRCVAADGDRRDRHVPPPRRRNARAAHSSAAGRHCRDDGHARSRTPAPPTTSATCSRRRCCSYAAVLDDLRRVADVAAVCRAGMALRRAARVAHSVIHCTYNRVMHRLYAFIASTRLFVLWSLWARSAAICRRGRGQ